MVKSCVAIAALSLWGTYALAEIAVPSGQPISLYDVVLDPTTETARFLFMTPRIARDAGDLTFADVEGDFMPLCQDYALPALAQNNWQVQQVVVSFADRQVEFGIITPEATQFFEMYSVQNNTCIWEGF